MESELTGLLLIDKKSGITSHGVVEQVRRILRTKRVGHTGTLDPQATGLLILCIGRATKVARFLSEEPKVYRAICHLGVVTDTLDMTGEVLKRRAVEASEEEIREAFEGVRGKFEQMPPMVSALKHEGKPLYEYARAGIQIERQPRPVEIFDLSVEEIERDGEVKVTFTVRCSRGTYIRSLCDDLGSRLGCGGAMGELRRLAAGRFRVEDAVTLDRLRDLPREELPLLELAAALADLPGLRVNARALRAVANGLPLKPVMVVGRLELPAPGELVRVLSPEGRLLAVHEATNGAGTWVTRTVRVI